MRASEKFDVPVGQRLERIRKALGFKNQADFAAAFGANKTQYNNWANGQNGIPPDCAARIREKFGVSLDYIYCGDVSSLPLRLVELLDASSSSDA